MRIQICIAAAALAALAACGSSNKANDGAKTSSGGSGPTVAGVKLQPGEWEMTMEVLNVNAPGLPAGIAAAMKRKTTNKSCMTQEEANGPKADIFSGKGNANCTQEGFSWADGRIHGTTTCTGSNGQGKTVMTIDGQYAAQSMDVGMKMNTEAQGKSITFESRMTGRRIGDCPAGATG